MSSWLHPSTVDRASRDSRQRTRKRVFSWRLLRLTWSLKWHTHAHLVALPIRGSRSGITTRSSTSCCTITLAALTTMNTLSAETQPLWLSMGTGYVVITSTNIIIYCIARNFRQEKIFTNFSTCSHWQKILSHKHFFLCYWLHALKKWQLLLHWWKFYSTKHFCTAKVIGLGEIPIIVKRHCYVHDKFYANSSKQASWLVKFQ